MKYYNYNSRSNNMRSTLPLQERLVSNIDLYNIEDFDRVFGTYMGCKKQNKNFRGHIAINVFPEPIILHLREGETLISAPNSNLGVVLRNYDFDRIIKAYSINRKQYPTTFPYKAQRMLVDLVNFKLLNSPVVNLYEEDIKDEAL